MSTIRNLSKNDLTYLSALSRCNDRAIACGIRFAIKLDLEHDQILFILNIDESTFNRLFDMYLYIDSECYEMYYPKNNSD